MRQQRYLWRKHFIFSDKLPRKSSPLCCKLISYNLEIVATGQLNTFLAPFSFHFKHENLRREINFFFHVKYPGLNLLPTVVPFLVLARLGAGLWPWMWGCPELRGSSHCWVLVQDSSALSCQSLLPLRKCRTLLPSAVFSSLLYVLAMPTIRIFNLSVENKTFQSKGASDPVLF